MMYPLQGPQRCRLTLFQILLELGNFDLCNLLGLESYFYLFYDLMNVLKIGGIEHFVVFKRFFWFIFLHDLSFVFFFFRQCFSV